MDPAGLVSRLANGRNTAVDAAAQAEFSEKRSVEACLAYHLCL